MAEANYDYSGIGKAEAVLLFSALASSPWVVLTNGLLGTVVFGVLTKICTFFANYEVLIVNVGVTDLQVLLQKGDFNGSFDDAFKAIHGNPDRLTPQEKAKIDAPVKAAFRKFAVFGQLPNGSNSRD